MTRTVFYTKTKHVSRHRGTLPVLLTCPHGGSESIANVKERTDANTPSSCTGANKFRNGTDRHTAEITKRIAQRMYEAYGESPYVVVAEFSRKFIDANRPSSNSNTNCAFVDKDARKNYDEYHKWVRRYVNHILANNNNNGFLFDVHGTRRIPGDPADIYIGTKNGSTLQPAFNRSDLFKRRGLVGLLQAAKHLNNGAKFKFVVSPAKASITETGEVNGAFTVINYGGTINAIQLELAPEVRDNASRMDILIEELAFTLVNFAKQYTGV
jgi:hypothetical protein